ncbi:MAG: hypothetical protein KME26_14720 [Oscillatoria princeps RMCB-10]|nr:hypothetical protein [Oscillatoria princeps RMCB-10]
MSVNIQSYTLTFCQETAVCWTVCTVSRLWGVLTPQEILPFCSCGTPTLALTSAKDGAVSGEGLPVGRFWW